MGEAEDYEQMMQSMDEYAQCEQVVHDMMHAQAMKNREAEFNGMPANGWQRGCPFKLKDIVYSAAYKEEGKVIGLPTLADEQNANEEVLGKAWVHFSDGSRDWVVEQLSSL